jgi:AcrR family transcriptional regulator
MIVTYNVQTILIYIKVFFPFTPSGRTCQSDRRAIIFATDLHTIAMTAMPILPRQTKTPEPDDARLRQGEKTREIILEAAAKLLVRSSASGMAMSELVKATGVPASSIYWHFGSKDGVVSAVIETGVQRWLQQFPDPPAWQATGEEGVRAVMEAFISSLKKDSQFIKLLLKVGLEFSEQENECVRIVRDARAKTISYAVSVLSPFFGSMPAMQAKAAAVRVARKLMALADGISITQSLEKSPATAEEMLDGMTEIALSLIRQETLALKVSRR